jgi:ABC-type sugar transport system ATPase subunit
LIGENGAGKSTLIKLISGVYQPDAGDFQWQGEPVQFASPSDSLAKGIATIHQELDYFGQLSIAENMLIGEAWPRTAWGGVNWKALNAEAVGGWRTLNFHSRPAGCLRTYRGGKAGSRDRFGSLARRETSDSR